MNIGFAESAKVTIPNKAPMPVITNPVDGAVVAQGNLVLFHGGAADLEDGDIPGSSLQWTSDLDGALGTGSTLPVSSLRPGVHRITLSATDGNGASAATSIEVIVPVVDPPTTSPQPSYEGGSVTARATFTGAHATACTVYYGDDEDEQPGTIGEGTCAGEPHVYRHAGRYPVTVTVYAAGAEMGTGVGYHDVLPDETPPTSVILRPRAVSTSVTARSSSPGRCRSPCSSGR